jgi:methylphosphotriester-DNA--protein-cysteine methyltransferase
VQLADFFKISPEAIRRILKSKWRPSPKEEADRMQRWQRRRQSIAKAAIIKYSFHKGSNTLERYRTSHIFHMNVRGDKGTSDTGKGLLSSERSRDRHQHLRNMGYSRREKSNRSV